MRYFLHSSSSKHRHWSLNLPAHWFHSRSSSSFTWLSAQVHSNMVMHFSGRIADSFDREFRCLYADSQIIDCFCNPEDEGMPYYPSYQAMMAPGMGLGPVMGLDLVSDRYFLFHLFKLVKHYFLLTFESKMYICILREV